MFSGKEVIWTIAGAVAGGLITAYPLSVVMASDQPDTSTKAVATTKADSATSTGPLATNEEPDPFWYDIQVGWSSGTERRKVRHIDDPELWTRTFANLRAKNIDRVFFWNHAGITDGGGPMRFDYILDAIVEGEWNLLSFPTEATKWLEEKKSRRLVIYIGSPEDWQRRRYGEEIERLIFDLILFHPQVEVCFDAASGRDENSNVYKVACELRDAGRTVWVEAIPSPAMAHWRGFGIVCQDLVVRNWLRDRWPAMTPKDAREFVVFYTGHDRNPEYETPPGTTDAWKVSDVDLARVLWRYGYTPGFGSYRSEDWRRWLSGGPYSGETADAE